MCALGLRLGLRLGLCLGLRLGLRLSIRSVRLRAAGFLRWERVHADAGRMREDTRLQRYTLTLTLTLTLP